MATPSAPPVDKENVQDTLQTLENNMDDSNVSKVEEKTVATEIEDPVLPTDTAESHDDKGIKDAEMMEEGRQNDEDDEPKKKRGSVAPRSPSQLGRNPPPKRKPLWLWMVIILVALSFIGALVITVFAATQGGLTRTAMGFLIFFAIVIVCVAPIMCYTRANVSTERVTDFLHAYVFVARLLAHPVTCS